MPFFGETAVERVLEPELMTEEEDVCTYAGADFSEAHQAYVRLFAELCSEAPAQARTLDLGCGPGDVTFRFSRSYPGWDIHAVDGSAAMLDQAQRALAAEPTVAARVTLIQGLLPNVTLPPNCYQIILSTSLLHHLPNSQALWQTVLRSAAPGAFVFVADFFRSETPNDAAALVDRYAASEPDALRRSFYDSLRAAFTPDEVTAQLADAGLSSLQVQTISDRHLVVWGRLPG